MLKCRSCLKCEEHDEEMKDIYENINESDLKQSSIRKMLLDCAPVRIEQGDQLPTRICKKCFTSLEAFHKFRELIVSSDLKLRLDLEKSSFINNKVVKDEMIADECDLKLEKNIGSKAANTTTTFVKVENELDTDNETIDSDIDAGENSNCSFDSNIESKHCEESIKNELSVKNNVLKHVESDIGSLSGTTNLDANDKSECESSASSQIVASGKRKGRSISTKKVKKRSKIFKCSECDKTFDRKRSLEVHSSHHSGIRPFQCDVCKKTFVQAYTLKVHARVHTNERPYSCEVCGKGFKFYSGLHMHKRIHTGEKPFKCKYCPNSYTQIGNLQTHERTHTGEKPFICEICSKCFRENATLLRHIRTHTGEKNYPCDFCGKLFLDRSRKLCHEKSHSGEKPYECEVCNKRFTYSKTLRIHKDIHEGNKRFACQICGKRFTQSNCVVRHMRVHTGEQPYSCTVCDKRFAYTQQMLNHMKTHNK